MKRITILLIAALAATASLAQTHKDVTQFLGIPVDGFKPEMINKLKDKGYTVSSSNKDVLVGEFNGMDVIIGIVTNNNKVCRIVVSDANNMNEADIKIRFNNLCRQFQNNENYMSSGSDQTIPEDEDISYSMLVDNKQYDAVFFQKPAAVDSVAVAEEVQSLLLSKYTEEQVSNPTEELQDDIITIMSSYMVEKYLNKVVWFTISESYGEYYISMYYDNEYNRANGEDL